MREYNTSPQITRGMDYFIRPCRPTWLVTGCVSLFGAFLTSDMVIFGSFMAYCYDVYHYSDYFLYGYMLWFKIAKIIFLFFGIFKTRKVFHMNSLLLSLFFFCLGSDGGEEAGLSPADVGDGVRGEGARVEIHQGFGSAGGNDWEVPLDGLGGGRWLGGHWLAELAGDKSAFSILSVRTCVLLPTATI